MRGWLCLHAACAAVLSAAAMPLGLHLAALGDVDADDDGAGAVVTATASDGGTVSVPEAWLVSHPGALLTASGSAVQAVNGPAANGRKVWDCYVLGLDPEVATNDFKIVSFPMKADGTPDLANIVFEPPQARWNVPGAVPKVMGAATLDGPWGEVPAGGNPGYRFFKVEVVLP